MSKEQVWIVSYRPRGNNYRLMIPYTIAVIARSKKEAKENAIMRVGDIYRVVNVEPQKSMFE